MVKNEAPFMSFPQLHGVVHMLDQFPRLSAKIGDVVFEVQYGMTPVEVEKILAEERKANATLYRDYRIELQFSNEYAPSRVDEVEAKATERFPGIEVSTFEDRSSRDCVAQVQGPNREVCEKIQSWADKFTH